MPSPPPPSPSPSPPPPTHDLVNFSDLIKDNVVYTITLYPVTYNKNITYEDYTFGGMQKIGIHTFIYFQKGSTKLILIRFEETDIYRIYQDGNTRTKDENRFRMNVFISVDTIVYTNNGSTISEKLHQGNMYYIKTIYKDKDDDDGKRVWIYDRVNNGKFMFSRGNDKFNLIKNTKGVYVVEGFESCELSDITLWDSDGDDDLSAGGRNMKHKYKGRSYAVKTGARGGRYIVVKAKKVYVS